MARPYEVHQFLPSLGWRDAVGTHTVQMRRALLEAGYRGRMWAEEIHPELHGVAAPPDGYPGLRSARKGGNVLVYQASTGSHGVVAFLAQRPEPKAIYFHNITPGRFFEAYAPAAGLNLTWGREELKSLVPHLRVAMANSEFSARELRALGVEDVRVIPPYMPPTIDAAPNPTHSAWLRRTKRGMDLLSVGRVVPHKGHLHLLRTFAAVRAGIDPHARLFVVGAWGPEDYMRAVFRLRERLELEGVVFTGSVSEATLASHYQEADLYLSQSEHEGFGLPLIEAMRSGKPVVAYDGGAVGETLDHSGVLLRTLDPALTAEVIAKVVGDEGLQAELVKGQTDRLTALEAEPRDPLIVRAVTDAAGS